MRVIQRLIAWLLGRSSPIGWTVPGWNAAVADQHATNTERLLLGAWTPAKRETAADRARGRMARDGQ